MSVLNRIVDLLPERLWAPGNIFLPRWGTRLIGSWHFCATSRDGRSVRTIERNGKEILQGNKPFDFAAHHPD